MKSIILTFSIIVVSLFSFANLSATNIGGTVASDITLDIAGSPYTLTSDYIIPDSYTLTIEAGVEIQLNHYSHDIFINGSLIAEGSPTEHITFHSLAGNGGGTLVFNASTNTHSLLYCDFESLGTFNLSGYDTGLRLNDTALDMDHCTFTNCGGTGGLNHIYAYASSLSDFGPNNSLSRVLILAGAVDKNCSWPMLNLNGFEYRVQGDLTVPSGITLTIAAGVDVNFNSYTRDLLVDGSLVAQGTELLPISLYSSATNGGGTVVLRSGSTGLLEYCEFSDLGTYSLSTYDTGLYNQTSDLQMDHCSFDNCGTGGTRHIKANVSSVSDIGPNNSLDKLYFLSDSIMITCTWPNIDSEGFNYEVPLDITLLTGNQLTIEPGVQIDFKHYTADLLIEGELVAIGTESNPIKLYSSLGNGGGTLLMRAESSGILEYCEFNNLGRYSLSAYDTGLYNQTPDLQMDYCTFDNCGTGGTRHIKADASSISDIGHNNSLEKLYFLSDSIKTTCTWPNIDSEGFNYEIPSDLVLVTGQQLTIEPGIHVAFNSYTADLIIDGNLVALGTELSPIRLYSSAGNGGGSLVLSDNSTAFLLYLEFEALGKYSLSTFDTGLYIYEASVTADYLTFENCGASGKRHITALQDVLSDFGTNNTIEDVLIKESLVDQDATWPRMDAEGFRYILSNTLTLDSDASLTIAPGTEILLQGYAVNLLINGSLLAVGTSVDSIRFHSTSSNGGGSLVFEDSSTSNELKYCSISRLGTYSLSSFDAGIRVENGDLSVEKSTIRESRRGIHVISGQPTIVNNIIKNNNLYGLLNQSDNDIVTACDNYWGDPSGPYNPTSNPTGLGDRVSDNVLAIDCDADPLEIVCPSDTTLFIGDNPLPDFMGEVNICLRDCGLSSTLYADDIEFTQCTEDMTRTWSVTDTCGYMKTCQQTISWVDSISPTIICPADDLLTCNQILPIIDFDEVLSMDNCTMGITETFEGDIETVIGCLHEFERTFKVTDAAGNSSSCTTNYSVIMDITGPQIQNVPTDITVECDAIPEAAIPNAIDGCGTAGVTFSETTTGTCPGTITRTWTATDECGNSTVEVQVITVILPPCPEDINGDGTVDILDFIQFNSAFGMDCTGCPEDITADGTVDISDFIQFNSAFGSDCADLLTNDDVFTMQQNNYSLSQEVSRSGMLNLNQDLEKLLHESNAPTGLSLYPVPSNGESIGIQLNGFGPTTDHSVKYAIHDMTGKLIRQGSSELNKDQAKGRIQLEQELEAGIYLLKAEVAGVFLSEQLIVE